MFRLSHALYGFLPTRPLAFVLKMFGIVWAGTDIHPKAEIGPGVCMMHSQKITIGAGVHIGSDVRISHGVSIGGDLGRGSTTQLHEVWPRIGDGVTIGMDVIIMGPVTIGDGAVIGAQSLVMKDVPPYGVVVGSPARLLRIQDPPAVLDA
jgi:serine O-acetyltransferase